MPRPSNPIPQGAPPELAELARQLRELRERAGLTLRQLADRAHCSQAALSEAASGKKLPSWSIAENYVKGCGQNPQRWRELWERAEAASALGSPPVRTRNAVAGGPGQLGAQAAETSGRLRWALGGSMLPRGKGSPLGGRRARGIWSWQRRWRAALGRPAPAKPPVPPYHEDPVLVASVEGFVRALRALRHRAGDPSFSDMSQRAAAADVDASPTALRDACSRVGRLPTQRTVDAFLAAFGITAEKHKKKKRDWDNALRRAQAAEDRRKRSLRSRRGMLAIAAVGCVIGGVIAGFLVWPSPAQVTGNCSPGQLVMAGSTAFTPSASAEGQEYQGTCGNTRFTVISEGSIDGLNALLLGGRQGAASTIAMSDGPAPDEPSFTPLHGTPVAVVVFELVVNPGVTIRNLTTSQVQGIFDGKYTNWAQVGGPDLPVRIISRGAESGTRVTFEKKVLHGTEPPVSSTDCVDKDRVPASPVTRCEEPSTPTLLAKVAATPGAIGYSEVSAAAHDPGVMPVILDGREPGAGAVPPPNGYGFWTTEYLYTYGRPPYRAPAAGFLRYMTTPAAKAVLKSQGFVPCYGHAQHLSAICQTRLSLRLLRTSTISS